MKDQNQPSEGQPRRRSSLTPEQGALRARIAAHTLHSRIDSKAHTEPARRAFLSRFEDQVDPDRVLLEAERSRRA